MPKRPKRVSSGMSATSKVDDPVAKRKKFKVCDNPNLTSCGDDMIDRNKVNVKVLNDPVKSPNDSNVYKVIQLSNGLVACLISDPSHIDQEPQALDPDAIDAESDPESSSADEESGEEANEGTEDETDEETDDETTEESGHSNGDETNLNKSTKSQERLAAACLCVSVGSFSDPKEIPGMAHFLEHMVFMGSEKYPQENDFDSFLKKRGGYDNASTDVETTQFYFECLEEHLPKALNKFVQFFISPLMKRDSMTRERESIESEFQMAIQNDPFRMEQLYSSMANEETPVKKFLWGNLKTLRDNVSDDILFNEVHKFRKQHYSAHRMTLAVKARLPVETLENLITSWFSKVPTNDLPGDDFTMHKNVFDNPKFKRLYYIKPAKDICVVDLTWVLPSLLKKYKTKPQHYVSYLLGHEGNGSLLSYLKKRLWALSITTGNDGTGFENNTMYTLFTASLVLTPEGFAKINEVIEAVFSYINLLKKVGPQERIYEEIKNIDDTSFRFKDYEASIDLVENLAVAMQYYPPEDYLTGNDLYFEYNAEDINMVIDHLTPKNLNIAIQSWPIPEDIVFDKEEPWFSIPYTDKEITEEWIEKWSTVKPMDCFYLPEDNPFLTSNFSILNYTGVDIPIYPEKIVDNELVELWYKPDNKFRQPKAFIYYYLISPLIKESVQNTVMFRLLINLLDLQLTEEVYPAVTASLNYKILNEDYGLVIKCEGFNEKLNLLLLLIIQFLTKLPDNVTPQLLSVIQNANFDYYHNNRLQPSKFARGLRLSILTNLYYPATEKLAANSHITFEDFMSFSKKFLRNLHIQGLIQGNLTQEEALNINNNVVSLLNCETLPMANLQQIQVAAMPVGNYICRVSSFNTEDCNCVITNYYQFGPGNIRNTCLVELLILFIKEPLFDILRTKEQLGYELYCSECDTYGILGFLISVTAQIQKTTTEHVDARIDSFVKQMLENIKKFDDKEIYQVKTDLIKVKKLVDDNSKAEISRNWLEILRQQFLFDRVAKEIAAIETITPAEFRKWAVAFLDPEKSKKLSIQVVGHKKGEVTENSVAVSSQANDFANKNNTTIKFNNDIRERKSEDCYITDMNNFKKSLNMYPVHFIIS